MKISYSNIYYVFIFQTFHQLWFANMIISSMTQSIEITFAPSMKQNFSQSAISYKLQISYISLLCRQNKSMKIEFRVSFVSSK